MRVRVCGKDRLAPKLRLCCVQVCWKSVDGGRCGMLTTEWKACFLILEGSLVCLGGLLGILVVLKIMLANAASLFIWGCSVPLAVVSHAVWIFSSGGSEWSPAILFIEVFLLAQLGWLGGGLAVAGVVVKVKATVLKKVALWTSIVSVSCHGLFLALIFVFGYGSS